MVWLGNRTYRSGEYIELPKYFLKLHQTPPANWDIELLAQPLLCTSPYFAKSLPVFSLYINWIVETFEKSGVGAKCVKDPIEEHRILERNL